MSQCHLTSMSAAILQMIFSNLNMIWNLVFSMVLLKVEKFLLPTRQAIFQSAIIC